MMKIGLIAMSGVRADSPALNRAGLTMPGVVERGKVIASMPSLSLLTLAALTPRGVEVEYREIRDLRKEGELPECDLAAIATFSAQVLDAYKVADEYRRRGTAVVMGGIHVSVLPDEALGHCSSVVIGEAEGVWGRVVEDFRAGRLERVYRADEEFDLADAPLPRYELLDIDKYNRLPVQTSRGCPHRCEFCASSILLTRKYKVKPVSRVLDEIRRIKRLWDRPFIEFADDNSFVSRRHGKELMKVLTGEDVRWFTESDISIANDPELLELMREAGCRQVLIGLESPTPSGLKGLDARDWKLRQFDKYEWAVREIQSRGITVNGCFILGLDSHTPETFDEVYRFVERTGVFDVQITVVTPFPGTPLYARLLAEGRIIQPGAWNKCTLFDVNFEPKQMSASELQRGLVALAGRLYDGAFTAARHKAFFAAARKRGVRPAMPELAA